MASASLSDIQRKVLDRIDEDEIVRLASDLIRIPSFTTEETPCAEWLAKYPRDQGLSPVLQEVEPRRKQTRAPPSRPGGRPCHPAPGPPPHPSPATRAQ